MPAQPTIWSQFVRQTGERQRVFFYFPSISHSLTPRDSRCTVRIYWHWKIYYSYYFIGAVKYRYTWLFSFQTCVHWHAKRNHVLKKKACSRSIYVQCWKPSDLVSVRSKRFDSLRRVLQTYIPLRHWNDDDFDESEAIRNKMHAIYELIDFGEFIELKKQKCIRDNFFSF